MNNATIGITIGIGVSFLFLYTRKTKWMKPKIVWAITIGLFLIGMFEILFTKPELKADRILYLGLCIPLTYWTFDRIFKRISENIHSRDFILFLRGSGEVNERIGAKNPHVKISDKLFTFGLVIIIIGTLLIGIQVGLK